MTESKVGLNRIGQMTVMVADLERAVPFYRDKLGMRFPVRGTEDGVLRRGRDPADAGRAGAGGVRAPGVDHLLQCAELDVAYGALRDRGVEFENEPHFVADLWKELSMAFLRDSEGNMLALMSETHKAG